MISELWKNDLYINPNIPFVFNKEIFEYDMKEGGFSLTKEFKLLDSKTIENLDKLKKEKRKIELGLIQRNNTDFRDSLKNGFREARRLFFIENNLNDNDIISIKKDAIFTTKKCTVENIGKYITFRVKNIYTSYIQLNKKIELYYNEIGDLDIKGLSDENKKLHEDYMIDFIKKFIYKMETEKSIFVIDFTKRFIDKYKRRELPVGYYRTFDFHSRYLVLNDYENEFTEYWEENKDELDISYNLYNVLLKLIQIPL